MQTKIKILALLMSLFTVSCGQVTASSAPQETRTVANTCQIIDEKGTLSVLSDEVFFAYGPSEDEIHQSLADKYPQWASFQQNFSWSPNPVRFAKIVREASFQEKFALNPTVTLITLGEGYGWQLPKDNDLFKESLSIGEQLVHFWHEFSNPDNQAIRSQHPEISSGATYSLYMFFKSDKEKLQSWCDAYQDLFGTSPMQR